MSIVGKIKRQFRTERILKNYGKQNRLIDSKTYAELKKEHKCRACKKKTICEIHHIIPLSKGGTNGKSNLTILCSKCHARFHKIGSEVTK